ncbi:MAG TPA: hypothetical protein P5513_06700 [Candidatus Diapherotrites archaeon]|nr:hypothetical protein [Candidatus Diapherotrites archaeon]
MATEKKKNKNVQEVEFSKEPAMNNVASDLLGKRAINDPAQKDVVPTDITADLEKKIMDVAKQLDVAIKEVISSKNNGVLDEDEQKKIEELCKSILTNTLKEQDEAEDETDNKDDDGKEPVVEPVDVVSTAEVPDVDDNEDVVQAVVSVEEPVDEDDDANPLMAIIGEFLEKLFKLDEEEPEAVEPMEEPEEIEPEQDVELEPASDSEEEFDVDQVISTVETFIRKIEEATPVDKAKEKVAKNFEDPDAESDDKDDKNNKDVKKTTEAETDDADLDMLLKDIDNVEEKDETPEKSEDSDDNKKVDAKSESYVPLPIAINATWSPVNSSKRIMENAVKTDGIDFDILKQAYLYVEPGKENDIDAYQYPIADIIDGKLFAIPGAIKTLTDIFANDGTLKALKVNDAVVKEVRSKLEKYLEQMSVPVPWKEDSESQSGNIKFKESSGLLSIYSAYEEFDPAMVLRKFVEDADKQ